MLLHKRQRAMDACGDPAAHRCHHCGGYDRQEDMMVSKPGARAQQARHRDCHATAERRRRLTSRRVAILGFLFVALLSSSAQGQGFRISQSSPDCNVTETAFDNPFSDTRGWEMRRVYWHASYAVTSFALAWALDRVTGRRMPHWLTAGVVITGVGVVPHVRSVLIQRRYPINPGDIAYDFTNRFTPAIWAVDGDSTKTWWQNHRAPFAYWLAADLALACFASP